MSFIIYIVMFIVLGGIIVLAGKRLSVYGDIIGDYKGWEKSWIGIVMLASITSLPELITSSSASLMGSPEMAISNVFGSNLFNIFIIFLVEIFVLKGISFMASVSYKNILTGFFSIFITLIFLLGMMLGDVSILNISIISIILLVLYFIAMKLLYNNQNSSSSANEDKKDVFSHEVSFAKARNLFTINALIVVIIGVLIVFVSDKIAVTTIPGTDFKLGKSFVGVILLALATSLPEMTVSFEAVKRKNYDLAAGNILGSNLFNLAIIFVADLFYRKKGIVTYLVEKPNEFKFVIISGILSILILSLFLIGIAIKNKKNKSIAICIGIFYFLSMFILYKLL